MSGYNIKAIDAELAGLNERIMFGNATIAKQEAKLSDFIETILWQKAEIERLRALVEAGYAEGWNNAVDEYFRGADLSDCWASSDTRTALQPKEDAA
jgi:hypothetical protein